MSEARRKKVRLGELLLEQKLITPEQLQSALDEQKRSGRKLGRVLTDLGLVREEKLHEVLAANLQIPFIDVRQLTLDPQTVRLLPEVQARRFRTLVLQSDARGLLIGMADPTDLMAYDELAARLKQPLRVALVKEADLLKTMDMIYRRTDEIASIAQEVREELHQGDIDLEQLSADDQSPDAPVIRLIQSMFQDAVQMRASDLHIEPGENTLRVRQRVDGVLQEQKIDGRRVAGALVTRLKLMSGLDIAEKRLPQDGRFSLKVKDKVLDVRISTMPTQHGESVVMRLLDQSGSLMTLGKLGMSPSMLARFVELITRSAGMVLVTGPTGSGKTTTLYSALNQLNQPDTKIITVEDPVEYRLDRVNQVQVNTKIQLDFARVLRTTLRQDPDVILVGEMRDRETVDIGLRAAITGHLVFSTLHTMNAAATIHRLLDMGAASYMIAAALHGIVAQRLVRRVCDNCAQPTEPTPQQRAWLTALAGATRMAKMKFQMGVGCTYCNLTGYRGRAAIYELVEIDRPLADAIRRGDSTEFADLVRQREEFTTLTDAALDLVADGTTSVAEAMSCTGGLDEDEPVVPKIESVSQDDVDSLLNEALKAARFLMPVFTYTGRARGGELASGLMEGDTPDGVAARLLGNGVTPIEIAAARAESWGNITQALRGLGFGKPTASDLVLLSRQMYTITKSGIPLLRGIKGLAASTHNAVLREILEEVLRDLESGRDLAGSLARHPKIFPQLYVSIIRVGEETGTLEASFHGLAGYLQQDQDMQDRIKAALRYPAIVMCVIAAAIAVLTMFVIPKFEPLFRQLGDHIPWPTLAIMGLSSFVQHYWYVVIGTIAAAAFGTRRYLQTETGRFRWDTMKLRLPVIGKLVHEGSLARISRSLSISMTAGMPVIQTLKIIGQAAGNQYMADRVSRLREAVERGEPVSRAAASVGMFPPLVLQMLAVGEETGDISELLDEVADFYEREVDYALKNLSAAIEPLLIIAVGGIVCILALGVMLPMWEMISRVQV